MISLTQLTSSQKTPAVNLKPDKCVHKRHKEASCQLCFDACPTHAITVGHPVALDTTQCVECGLCVHLCPTEAFTQTSERSGNLQKVLMSLDDGRVEFACPRKENIAHTRADVTTIVEIKPCLASLSLPVLFKSLAHWKTNRNIKQPSIVWLNDEPCVDCPIGSVHNEIIRLAQSANHLLAAMGEESRVRTYCDSPELLSERAKKRPVEQSHRPRYTRRGVFRSFAGLEERTPENKADNDSRLSKSRALLLHSLTQLGQPVTGTIEAKGLPFGSVSITGACVACGLCARFCPSEALFFQSDDNQFSIDFVPANCIGCSICTLICPTKVVDMKPDMEMLSIFSRAKRTLVTGVLAECEACGMPCAADEGESLCFVCRWRKTVPDEDVLGRLDAPP